MKLSRNLAPNRLKPAIFVLVFTFLLEIQLSDCAKVVRKEDLSVNSTDSIAKQGSVANEASLTPNPTHIHITDLTRTPAPANSQKNGLIIPKTAFRLLRKISKDYILPSVSKLLSSRNGSSLSKRSHDSTFGLISFVTFATFVLFALLPLLTLPRRQRIARGYVNRFRAKNKLKPLSSHFFKPAKLSRYKKPANSQISYAAVAVPIDSGGGGGGSNVGGRGPKKGHRYRGGGGGSKIKSQQQEDFESDVDDLWNSREPRNPYGMGDPAVGIKTYSMGGGAGAGAGYGMDGGWSSQESQPIHLSTLTDSDNEYLTKDEIMYLLKTL